MMNEPRLNFWPPASKGSSATSMLRVLEAIAQRRERRIGVVIDREERRRSPVTPPAAVSSPLTGSIAASSTFASRDAHDLDVEQLAERPSRVVVRIALRVVRRPGTDSRAACRRCGCTADPSAGRRCRPGTSASSGAAGLSLRRLLLVLNVRPLAIIAATAAIAAGRIVGQSRAPAACCPESSP